MNPLNIAFKALATDSIDAKLAAMALLAQSLGDGEQRLDGVWSAPTDPICREPIRRGVPPRPPRVQPHALAPRSNLATVAGRAALIHAVAHIEYSAIDLALDHAVRFAGMPHRYYDDWLKVALDEARHFQLLRAHLQSMGHDYGDFPVHDGLWEMAEKTANDCLTRMALVPRLLEARGLDATPPIQKKLAAAGDTAAVSILAVILADEENHVAIGDYWYRFLCVRQNLEPEVTFRQLIREYNAPWPQAPMNVVARLAAGFGESELECLTLGRVPK